MRPVQNNSHKYSVFVWTIISEVHLASVGQDCIVGARHDQKTTERSL